MKTIILYGRRNTGLIALSMLVALGYEVRVITDCGKIKWLATILNCEVIDEEKIGQFDLLLSVHWHKKVEQNILDKGICVNVHPMLGVYNGHNPIKRYIDNKDTDANVCSHYMTDEFDKGELIYEVGFETPVCKTYADFYNVAMPFYYMLIDRTLKIVL